MDAIAAQQLTKSYDSCPKALDGLTLSVPEGGICGFLGPNGAGKTTAVKLFTGLLSPTEGECRIMGLSPEKEPEQVHSLCGVMTESAKMYGQMTGMQNLLFFGQLFGVSSKVAANRASDLLKKLELWEARDKKAGAYSTGMLQRLSLARTLIADPKLLFLDEPTSGLDPESAQTVNQMISNLVEQKGVTVFLCTHQLRYAQDICNCYGIIDHGRLLAFGDFDRLCMDAGCQVKAGFRLQEGDSLNEFECKNGWWQTELGSEERMPELVRDIVSGGHQIYEARLINPTLEEVYFHYIDRGTHL